MEEKQQHESPRTLAIRATLDTLKRDITEEVTKNESLLPETKMRILEAIRVQPRDVLMTTLDESVGYAGEEPEMQTRDFLLRRIIEQVGPAVGANKNREEEEAFRKFMQRTVVGIHA